MRQESEWQGAGKVFCCFPSEAGVPSHASHGNHVGTSNLTRKSKLGNQATACPHLVSPAARRSAQTCMTDKTAVQENIRNWWMAWEAPNRRMVIRSHFWDGRVLGLSAHEIASRTKRIRRRVRRYGPDTRIHTCCRSSKPRV